MFIEGKLFRKAGEGSGGGGGSDPHNLGWYATEAALTTAHPTAEAGDWAIVGSTDTVWVWDTDTSAWVDTDTKGEVTSVNSKTGAVVLSAEDVGAVPQYEVMPAASATNSGECVQYIGSTGTYTHGYIYENKETTTYTDSVEFNPASISGTTVTATAGALAGLCEEYGSGDITDIIKGTLTYDLAGGLLVFVGLDDTDTQVCTFQLYTQDYEDAGFTFTGTLADGDVINFTCTITASSAYAWERIDVQPTPEALPDQTGQNGKYLTTNGTTASWGSINALQNTATGLKSLTILGTATSGNQSINIGKESSAANNYNVAIGYQATSNTMGTVVGCGASDSGGGVAVGYSATSSSNYGTAIGPFASVGAFSAIALGYAATNNTANTMVVCFGGSANYRLLNSDGTIPTARLTKVNSTVTLAAADWSAGTQTVTVSGVTSTGIIFVSPDPTDQAAYTSAGIIATAQSTDSITFTCTSTPSADIDVVVIML